MNQYYFAFKINPIDAMNLNFPRPHSQDYGVLCSTHEDAQTWLHNAALVPIHQQDWMYQRYHLPAVNMIVTVEPATTIPKLQEPLQGTATEVFASRMQQFRIVSTEFEVADDEVHPAKMVGFSRSYDFSVDSPLLRSVSSEISTRMTDIAEYQKAREKHADIPKEVIQTWASLMFSAGVHKHGMMEMCFDTFAECYAQEVMVSETRGPQYEQDVITVLAIENAARQLYAETYDRELDAFGDVLDSVENEALPYRYEQFMVSLEPEKYKTLFMEQVPQEDKEKFSTLWDATLNTYRNQIAISDSELRIQDISIQVAMDTCATMEAAAAQMQSDTRETYATLYSTAMQDASHLSFLDQRDEMEEVIE